MPAGHLVRLLAVCPDGLDPSAVTRQLWLGSNTSERERRKRLARLVAAVWDLVLRDGTRLVLADAWVDVQAFRNAADRAVRFGVEEDVRLALSLRTGDPLPADPYAPWAMEVREELIHQRLRLLDFDAELAAARGNTTEAVALLEDGAEADPYDVGRLERAAELLEAAGLAGAAAQAARRRDDLP